MLFLPEEIEQKGCVKYKEILKICLYVYSILDYNLIFFVRSNPYLHSKCPRTELSVSLFLIIVLVALLFSFGLLEI